MIWIKRLLRASALLLGLLLLVALAWWIPNHWDNDPQPWPAALTVPEQAVPADSLLAALEAVPKATGFITWSECRQGDCLNDWRSVQAQWPAQREKLAPLGAACEAQLQQATLRYVEPLPKGMDPLQIPRFQGLTACSGWLLTQALEAPQADQALALIQQSQRLVMALHSGSQTLIAHNIALSMQQRHGAAVLRVAQQHPLLAAPLADAVTMSAQSVAAAQRRWIAAEASLQRVTLRKMLQDCAGASVSERWQCRWLFSGLPEYTEQLAAGQWSRLLPAVDASDPVRTVAQVRALPEAGGFAWRGSFPHMLLDVAHPAYLGYFERATDVYLSGEASRLWLLARAEGVSAAQAAAWLAQRTQGGPLAAHLRIEPDGRWQLLPLSHQPDLTRLPTRWPALPASS